MASLSLNSRLCVVTVSVCPSGNVVVSMLVVSSRRPYGWRHELEPVEAGRLRGMMSSVK